MGTQVLSVSGDDANLASTSMLNSIPQQQDDEKDDAMDDLSTSSLDNSQLLNLLTRMVISQQKQMELYGKQMQKFAEYISSPNVPSTASKIALADFPKFSESVLPEDAIQYLGYPKTALTDEDILLCGAFKFFTFQKKFLTISANLDEANRLQTLLLCLKGVAQGRAVNVKADSCQVLLDKMNQWYASAADVSPLEDAVRSKLESTRRGKSELLPDYILRYRQYWDLEKALPDSCGLSERLCARLFIRTLAVTDSDLMAEIIRNRGYSCDKLQDIFDLTMDSAKILRMIREARLCDCM